MLTRLLIAMSVWALAAPAMAEPEWVRVYQDRDGAVAVDVSRATRSGSIARGAYRLELSKPKKVLSDQRYSTLEVLLETDCEKEKIRAISTTYLDAGRVVAQSGEGRWMGFTAYETELAAGRAICGLADSETVPSITKNGSWKSLARFQTFDTFYDVNRIESLDADHVMVAVRSDYREYKIIEGVPGRHGLTFFAVDCRDHAFAPLVTSFYLSPTVLLATEESSGKDLNFERITRGSLFDAEFTAICTAPRIAKGGAPRKSAEEGGLSVGTAWATNKGYLVTASHVVAGGGKIDLYQEGKKVGSAQLVANDPANDVALLKYVPAGGAKLKMIPLADRSGTLGRPVFTLGFPAPDVMGQRIKMSKGDIAATSGMQDDARFLQISMPIQQGNSGGPVVGFDGAAVGVVSAKLTRLSDEDDAPKPENVNYAVKVSYVRPLLDELPDLADYIAIKAAGLSQEDLVAQVSQAVYMVVVSQ